MLCLVLVLLKIIFGQFPLKSAFYNYTSLNGLTYTQVSSITQGAKGEMYIIGIEGINEELTGKLVEDMELSVRARRALARLNIQTLGELINKTEAELLGCKNFGVTSLNEIKERLTSYGLGLRKLE